MDVLSEEYIFQVYLGMAIGMGILLLSYTLVLLIMTGVVIKIVKKPFMLRWQETIFLSVLNIVGSMIVGISLDLSVVQIEGGVFLLYDDKQEMLWKLPIIAVLIYVKFRQYTSTRITGSFKKNGRNILWKNNRSKP